MLKPPTLALLVAAVPLASTASGAILDNGAIDFYNAESVTAGDTGWSDSVPGSGTNLTLNFNGSNAILAPGDASPGTAIDSAVVFGTGTTFANNTTAVLNNGDTTVSAEVWFKPTDLTGTETLFESGGGSNGTGIGLVGASLQANSNPGGSSVSHTLTADEILDFVQAVIVKDGDNNQFRLYVNGELVDTDTVSGDFAGADQTGLGGRSSGGQGPNGLFDGQIALVRLYDTALTDSQVLSAYNDIAGVVIPEPASLTLLALGGACLLPRRRR